MHVLSHMQTYIILITLMAPCDLHLLNYSSVSDHSSNALISFYIRLYQQWRQKGNHFLKWRCLYQNMQIENKYKSCTALKKSTWGIMYKYYSLSLCFLMRFCLRLRIPSLCSVFLNAAPVLSNWWRYFCNLLVFCYLQMFSQAAVGWAVRATAIMSNIVSINFWVSNQRLRVEHTSCLIVFCFCFF